VAQAQVAALEAQREQLYRQLLVLRQGADGVSEDDAALNGKLFFSFFFFLLLLVLRQDADFIYGDFIYGDFIYILNEYSLQRLYIVNTETFI
jgi:hypothetical protein